VKRNICTSESGTPRSLNAKAVTEKGQHPCNTCASITAAQPLRKIKRPRRDPWRLAERYDREATVSPSTVNGKTRRNGIKKSTGHLKLPATCFQEIRESTRNPKEIARPKKARTILCKVTIETNRRPIDAIRDRGSQSWIGERQQEFGSSFIGLFLNHLMTTSLVSPVCGRHRSWRCLPLQASNQARLQLWQQVASLHQFYLARCSD